MIADANLESAGYPPTLRHETQGGAMIADARL